MTCPERFGPHEKLWVYFENRGWCSDGWTLEQHHPSGTPIKHRLMNDSFLEVERVPPIDLPGRIETIGTHGILKSYQKKQV